MLRKPSILLMCLGLVCFGLAELVLGQLLNPVTISTKLEPAQINPGGKAKALITVKLEPGWHVYAMTQKPPPRGVKVTLDESGPFKLDGAPQQPKPRPPTTRTSR
jgi:DsbC/DsbD-like thiol-disulfide interchange protein